MRMDNFYTYQGCFRYQLKISNAGDAVNLQMKTVDSIEQKTFEKKLHLSDVSGHLKKLKKQCRTNKELYKLFGNSQNVRVDVLNGRIQLLRNISIQMVIIKQKRIRQLYELLDSDRSLTDNQEISQIFFPSYTDRNLNVIETPFSNQFLETGNRLQYLGENQKYTQVLLNKQAEDNELRFSCRIVKTRDRRIHIGIVDLQKQKNQRCSWNSGYGICYSGYNGRIRYCDEYAQVFSKIQGNGYEQQDFITVEVNKNSGIIRWLVNENERACLQGMNILKGNRVFVPFIQMFDKGDIVEYWP